LQIDLSILTTPEIAPNRSSTLNITEDELANHEWVEKEKDYRERLISAKIVNKGKLKRLPTKVLDMQRKRAEGRDVMPSPMVGVADHSDLSQT
jgi:hypothetical protein